MKKTITRLCQMDDWIFEVKMVRALKMQQKTGPYTAVANITANGEQVYIDTHLSIENEELSKEDYMTFYRFCQSMGMKHISYDRIKNGIRTSKMVEITENNYPEAIIRVVK